MTPPAQGPAMQARRPREALAALVLFTLLSAALFSPVLTHAGTSTTGTNDSCVLVWWLSWVPHALLHGHDVLVSRALFAPYGVNRCATPVCWRWACW